MQILGQTSLSDWQGPAPTTRFGSPDKNIILPFTLQAWSELRNCGVSSSLGVRPWASPCSHPCRWVDWSRCKKITKQYLAPSSNCSVNVWCEGYSLERTSSYPLPHGEGHVLNISPRVNHESEPNEATFWSPEERRCLKPRHCFRSTQLPPSENLSPLF